MAVQDFPGRTGTAVRLCLPKFIRPYIWFCDSENTILYMWYLSNWSPLESPISRAECWWGICGQCHSATMCVGDWSWIFWLSVVWRCTHYWTHLSALNSRSPAVGLDILKFGSVSKSRYNRCWGTTVLLQGHSRMFWISEGNRDHPSDMCMWVEIVYDFTLDYIFLPVYFCEWHHIFAKLGFSAVW